MKKTILTLSLVALFSVISKAQDSKTKQEPVKTVNSDGTITTATVSPSSTDQAPAKKSGTRMAINEKGLPGGSGAKKEPAKEEKTSPAMGQPGSSGKK